MKKYLVSALAVIAVSSQAQVVLTGPGTYFQNFDNLAMSGTGIAFVQNNPAPTMAGWYSNQTTYDADNGSGAGSGQYSYGSNNSPERALGSTCLPGAIIQYGIRLNNNSGGTFGSLNLNYIGEQWRDGAALTDVLTFEYSTNATSLGTGTWTNMASLDFNSVSNSGAGVLNGNLPSNQSFQSGVMTGLNWLNGTDMWVRWTHIGNGSRHALALDEMHLNANPVPEPSSIVAVGLACLSLGARRRLARSKK